MTSFLYIISEGESGPVKIGMSRAPEYRLAELQTGNPRLLQIVWRRQFSTRAIARDAEKAAHLFLSELKQTGEWFDIEPSHAIPATEAAIS